MADGNGFPSGEELDKYLQQIDDADDELVALKTEHMRSCKVPRGKIRGVMTQAKAAGINMAAFRALVTKHRGERKIDQTIAELEADERADFEALQVALGEFADTPLGKAAVDKAKPKENGKPDTLRA